MEKGLKIGLFIFVIILIGGFIVGPYFTGNSILSYFDDLFGGSDDGSTDIVTTMDDGGFEASTTSYGDVVATGLCYGKKVCEADSFRVGGRGSSFPFDGETEQTAIDRSVEDCKTIMEKSENEIYNCALALKACPLTCKFASTPLKVDKKECKVTTCTEFTGTQACTYKYKDGIKIIPGDCVPNNVGQPIFNCWAEGSISSNEVVGTCTNP